MRPSDGNKAAGFTLVEILLVMAIIGMIAGSVALTLPSSSPSQRSPQDLAVTLKEQLQYAREHAMVRQQPLGLHADDEGYRFLRWYDGQWQPLTVRGLQPVRWSNTIQWQLEPIAGNLMVQEQAARTLLFQADDQQDENEQAEDRPQPQILILPSGEITAFSLALDDRNLTRADKRWLVAASAWQVTIQEQPYAPY